MPDKIDDPIPEMPDTDIPLGDDGQVDAKALKAKYDGLKGWAKTVREKAVAAQKAWGLQQTDLTTQVGERDKALRELGTSLVALKETAGKLPDLQTQITALTGKATRQDLLMKYPAALRPEIIPLVMSSTLEGEALEQHIKVLADAFGSKEPPPVAPQAGGATPPPPPAGGGKTPEQEAEALTNEALKAMSDGKFDLYEAKMQEAWAKMDEAKGKSGPRPPHTIGAGPTTS